MKATTDTGRKWKRRTGRVCRPHLGTFGYPFRLRANDIIRIDGRLCRVLRVNYSAAVVLMNRPRRKFTTRFDKPVSFQPSPSTFRISAELGSGNPEITRKETETKTERRKP